MKPQLCTATTPGGHQTKMLGANQPAVTLPLDEALRRWEAIATQLDELAAQESE